MKKQEINKWKVATVILGIIALLLIGKITYLQEKETVKMRDLEISRRHLSNYLDLIEPGDSIQICEMEAPYPCVVIKKSIPVK